MQLGPRNLRDLLPGSAPLAGHEGTENFQSFIGFMRAFLGLQEPYRVYKSFTGFSASNSGFFRSLLDPNRDFSVNMRTRMLKHREPAQLLVSTVSDAWTVACVWGLGFRGLGFRGLGV